MSAAQSCGASPGGATFFNTLFLYLCYTQICKINNTTNEVNIFNPVKLFAVIRAKVRQRRV